jgi:hypothetical protein
MNKPNKPGPHVSLTLDALNPTLNVLNLTLNLTPKCHPRPT